MPVKYILITNKNTGHFGFEVFTVVLLRIQALWDVMMCHLVSGS